MSASVMLWRQMLEVAECDEATIDDMVKVVPTVRALAHVERVDLQTLPGWRQSQILMMKEWYLDWVRRGRPNINDFEQEFTIDAFENFAYDRSKPATQPNTTPATAPTTTTTSTGGATKGTNLMISNKLDARDIPKLKAAVSLKGKVFDDWATAFKVKLEQAGCTDILEPGYTPPTANDPDFHAFEVKANYLASHLVTATLNSHAYNFIDAKKQTGFDMWNSLLEIYSGRDHLKEDATNATNDMSSLHFGQRSQLTAEGFLAKFAGNLKRMETVDANGTVVPALSEAILPSVFRSKVTHPVFDTWKTISERDNESWSDIKGSFLKFASTNEAKLKKRGDQSDKVRVQNQNSEAGMSKESFEKLLAGYKGKGRIRAWHRLSAAQKAKIAEKRKASGSTKTPAGQYSANLQQLEPGSIVIPKSQAASYLQAVTNNQIAQPPPATLAPAAETSTGSIGTTSNQQRAKAMLQLANGTFVVQNTKVQISSRASECMSRVTYQQQLKTSGHIYVDGGTNCCVMGRTFRVDALTERRAEMSGFANGMNRSDVPIGSGLTKCVDKKSGYQFLLGLHESPHLPNNDGSLLSTGQTREAGIWLSDVLKRHGGDQRLVAPVEDADYHADLDLEVKDGLLAIECHYPTDDEWNTLPRVWLTSNEVPWDPSILDVDDDVVIPCCWDGVSPLETATVNSNAELGIDMFAQMEYSPYLVTAVMGTCLLARWFRSCFQVHDTKAKNKQWDYEKYRPRIFLLIVFVLFC